MANGRAAGIGDNNGKAEFLGFFEEYDDADAAVAEAVGARKDLRARIKGAGIILKAFDRARKLAVVSGEKREEEELALRRYMGWLQKPLGFQGRMFDQAPAAPGDGEVSPQTVERVERQGYEAGEAASQGDAKRLRVSNPWTPGTYLHDVWDAHWRRGAGLEEEVAAEPDAGEELEEGEEQVDEGGASGTPEAPITMPGLPE